jgi:beta-lactamase regulating signal transducer with metallopeptidase domain
VTTALLALLGLVLAGPAPALISRARWPLRAPRAGIVLWQAMALAAVLAIVGAGVSSSLWLIRVDDPGGWRLVAHSALMLLTLVVLVRLAWSAVRVGRATRARRRRLRELVDMLADRSGIEPQLRILAAPTPMAYCLPGVRNKRVVVSQGAMSQLDSAEVAAVLAHEHAHVRARHDLVLESFAALHAAFPRGPRSELPLRQSQLLVELLADDAARARTGAVPLARALVALAGQTPPAAALAASSDASTTRLRLERLAAPRRGRWRAAACAYATAAAILLGPTIFVGIPLLTEMWDTLR